MRARDLIKDAYLEIGVQDPQETVPAARGAFAFDRLNQMIRTWHTEGLTSLTVSRELFAVTALQNTYSIGPGGDFDTVRPVSLQGAGWVQNAGMTNELENSVGILTDDAYELLRLKNQQALLWTQVYYNPTQPLGSIFLWPTPTSSTAYELSLYLSQFLVEFADQTTDYDVAFGYEEALLYNLAKRLSTPMGVALDPRTEMMAAQTLANIKRTNVKLADLPNDASPVLANSRSWYNINTGSGGY